MPLTPMSAVAATSTQTEPNNGIILLGLIGAVLLVSLIKDIIAVIRRR